MTTQSLQFICESVIVTMDFLQRHYLGDVSGKHILYEEYFRLITKLITNLIILINSLFFVSSFIHFRKFLFVVFKEIEIKMSKLN